MTTERAEHVEVGLQLPDGREVTAGHIDQLLIQPRRQPVMTFRWAPSNGGSPRRSTSTRIQPRMKATPIDRGGDPEDQGLRRLIADRHRSGITLELARVG